MGGLDSQTRCPKSAQVRGAGFGSLHHDDSDIDWPEARPSNFFATLI